MNKLELVQKLMDTTDLSKPQAAAVVDTFFNEMAKALANGDRVEIRGLCWSGSGAGQAKQLK